MKPKRWSVLALAIVAATAVEVSQAAAQTATIRLSDFNNYGVINTTEYGPVYSSPYQGRFAGDPTSPLIDFYCIDFEHHAPALGSAYDVHVTNLGLGDLSGTRHGTGELAKYQQIAWLISRQPSVETTEWHAIQLAIWQTFSGSCPSGACARNEDVALNAAAAEWRQLALTGAASMTPEQFRAYEIVTGYGADQNHQEFMYVTPEPETYALLAIGLLTLFVAWRRRRRSDDGLALDGGFAGF